MAGGEAGRLLNRLADRVARLDLHAETGYAFEFDPKLQTLGLGGGQRFSQAIGVSSTHD